MEEQILDKTGVSIENDVLKMLFKFHLVYIHICLLKSWSFSDFCF